MIGSERTHEFVVEGMLLTDVGGTIPAKVLSSPGLIGMMERNCAMLALEHLPEGKATVGFEVCIKPGGLCPPTRLRRHPPGTATEGAECVAWAKLREVEDGRKWRRTRGMRPKACEGAKPPRVREGDRTLGVGTHERRVVERA